MSDENSPVGIDTQVNVLKLGNRKKPCIHRSSLVSHGDPNDGDGSVVIAIP
jgi:hypothetical protein